LNQKAFGKGCYRAFILERKLFDISLSANV